MRDAPFHGQKLIWLSGILSLQAARYGSQKATG